MNDKLTDLFRSATPDAWQLWWTRPDEALRLIGGLQSATTRVLRESASLQAELWRETAAHWRTVSRRLLGLARISHRSPTTAPGETSGLEGAA